MTDPSAAILDTCGSLDGPVVVALSGGADSAVAAWGLASAGITVRAVHVDHGLPGSPTMRAAASDVARRLDMDLSIASADPSSASEADLREARYAELFGSLVAGELLVTAHTADDQAETVLLNLLRGTGLPGLAGSPPSRGRIRRPLLGFTRATVRRAADAHRLPYADDPANRSLGPMRNRVRLELIPRLESGFSPSLRQNLARTAETVHDALEPMERAAATVRCEQRAGSLRVAVGPLMAVRPPVRRWILRRVVTAARGPHPPSRAEVDRIEAALAAGTGTDLADSALRAEVTGPWLTISESPGPAPAPAALDEQTTWGPVRFTTGPHEGGPRLSKWRLVHRGDPLTIRAAAPGDRIGMTGGGSKDVLEAIREAGLPVGHWPVVESSEGEIVWIPGARHAARVASPASGYFVTLAEEDAGWAPFHP